VAAGVYQACRVPVRGVISPVVGEMIGGDGSFDHVQPPALPLVRGLRWLVGGEQVIPAQGAAAVLLGQQVQVVAGLQLAVSPSTKNSNRSTCATASVTRSHSWAARLTRASQYCSPPPFETCAPTSHSWASSVS
jgi:hypothetical protein